MFGLRSDIKDAELLMLMGKVRKKNQLSPRQLLLGVGDVCFFLTMRCFNDAMFSNS